MVFVGMVHQVVEKWHKLLVSICIEEYEKKKENPYTTHPLSFEEFDNIPGIEDLIEKKEFLGEKDENKSK